MIYNSPAHMKKALLRIVIHCDFGEFSQFDILSIYKCQYFDMYIVNELWDSFDRVFEKVLYTLDRNQLYLVDLGLSRRKNKDRETTFPTLKWLKCVEITESMIKKDPYLSLRLEKEK